MTAETLTLIRRAAQAISARYEEIVGETISPVQMIVLSAIADADGPPTQTQLVNATGIDRSTMTDVLKRLDKRGYITRRRRKGDIRSVESRVTEQGLAALTKARDANALVEEELSVTTGLSTMHKALRQIVAQADGRAEAKVAA